MGKRILPANDSSLSPVRPPIDLRIQGDEIFLSGHFHRWQAMVSRGPDLDLLSVRMAVDVTSPDHLKNTTDGRDLFSFTSTNVMKLDDNVYRAEGHLNTTAGQHPFDVMIEIPRGHNAFFALAFSGRREVLGNVWPELMAASGVGDMDAERRLDPWASVRDPELAAA
jgi:polyisoprenoid-binding protein YceI